MIKTPVHDFLKTYSAKNHIRCHTPGHKGFANLHDITEVPGAVSIIEESEHIAASLFGAERTLYSCSGSTLAIQTMLTLAKPRRVAAFRGSHRSLISATALLGFEIDWFYTTEDIIVTPETDAVFMNSIDYHGNMYDVAGAAKTCKTAGVPLLVDNAHGAYLTFTGNHPLALGAAMTADSAHKTLPVLTGGAYLHISSDYPEYAAGAKDAMALFASTSPSYLVLESLDLCNRHIAGSKPAAFEYIAELKAGLNRIRKSDELRVTFNAYEYGYTGFEFADELRRHNIEPEYADINYTVLLFSTTSAKADTDAVLAAVRNIKHKPQLEPVIFPALKPQRAMNTREALFAANSKRVALSAAAGRICAEIISPCPPGVPLVIPGEIIGSEEAEVLAAYGISNIRVL
jgi:arginine/lysine/ornithine decarboxylase